MKVPLLKTAEDCIAFAQKVNPDKEHLTIERLKSYPGCENYTDEQATRVIQTLEQLAIIVFELTHQKRSTCIDNQEFVYLEQCLESEAEEPPSIPINRHTRKNRAA